MMVKMDVNYRVNDPRSITRTLFCFRPFFIRLIEVLPHALCRTWSRAWILLSSCRWMGSHPSVYSSHKALSPNKRNLPSLIILLKINRDDWIRRLKRRLNKPRKASLDRNYSFVSWMNPWMAYHPTSRYPSKLLSLRRGYWSNTEKLILECPLWPQQV